MEDLRKLEEEYRVRCETITPKLVNAPAIEVTSRIKWWASKMINRAGVGLTIITYAERWARLMQLEMASGKKLEDVAEATSREADFEGMSGFTYGCAAAQLEISWKHGDELRRWRNPSGDVPPPGILRVTPV